MAGASMTLGGCTSPKPGMPAGDACQFIRDLVAEHVKLEENPKAVEALNTIHLTINENENLRIDLAEAHRLNRDLYRQLDERRQAVFA